MLLVIMEVIDDLTHALVGEISLVESENSSFIHIV